MRKSSVSLTLLFLSAVLASRSGAERTQPVHHPYDFFFTSQTPHENPFAVEFRAEAKGPEGESFVVPGFHDGDGRWTIRFSGTRPGVWTLATRSDDPELDGKTATVECIPNEHPKVHGRLRVDPEHPRHFVYEDGTRYFLMGYECDWLWALDMGSPDLTRLNPFLDKLASFGFNHIILNGFAHDTSWRQGSTGPDDFGPPPMFPWAGDNAKPDHSRFNLDYWKHYDRMMQALFERGITAHLMIKVYNKKVKWPKRLSPEDDRYFRWLIARYAAYPNLVWDFSKESYNEKDLDYKLNRLQFIRDNDPYDHLITVHDDDKPYADGRYDDLADFQSDQQHKDWHAKIREQRSRREWPVVNVEFGYEHGPLGEEDKTYRIAQSGEENVRRAWEICMAGGYPAYYYTYTAWDVIRPEDEPIGYTLFSRFKKFWETTEYWKLEPSNELIESGYCLANPRKEYLFYFPNGEASEIDLTRAEAPMTGRWFRPYTGDSRPISAIEPAKQKATPPADWRGTPAVLHLKAE